MKPIFEDYAWPDLANVDSLEIPVTLKEEGEKKSSSVLESF